MTVAQDLDTHCQAPSCTRNPDAPSLDPWAQVPVKAAASAQLGGSPSTLSTWLSVTPGPHWLLRHQFLHLGFSGGQLASLRVRQGAQKGSQYFCSLISEVCPGTSVCNLLCRLYCILWMPPSTFRGGGQLKGLVSRKWVHGAF